MAAVGGWPLVGRAGGAGKAVTSEVAQVRPDGGVVEAVVEHDVEDLVEQPEAFVVALDECGALFGDLPAGPAVGGGEGLVEQPHDLVDDLGARRRRGGQQDRVAAVAVEAAQRPRRRAARPPGQLADALRRHHRQIQPVRADPAQVVELVHLRLDRLRGRLGGPGVEPDQRCHPQVGVGGEQPVELAASGRGEQRADPQVQLSPRGRAGRGDRPHQAVHAGPHDLRVPQVVERGPEQHRRRVVLQRSLDEPVAEPFPLAPPAGLPAGPLDDRGGMLAPRPLAQVQVVGEDLGSDPELGGEPVQHQRRQRDQLAGQEPEVAQAGELDARPSRFAGER